MQAIESGITIIFTAGVLLIEIITVILAILVLWRAYVALGIYIDEHKTESEEDAGESDQERESNPEDESKP